jgi:Gam-like protein
MATRVEPADEYEAWLDATAGLDPALSGAEPQQAPGDRFVVDDDHTADWALRKLGQLEAWTRERAAFVAAEMERLQAWQAHEDRQAERFAASLTALLRPYDDQLKAEGKVSARHKSYRLPHGTLTAHLTPIEWEVEEATLLAWAEATNPETLVRVTKAPAWSMIKSKLMPARDGPLAEATMEVIDLRTGEVQVVPLPGVRVKSGPREVFTPKPALAPSPHPDRR